jgi:hypothetical protein
MKLTMLQSVRIKGEKLYRVGRIVRLYYTFGPCLEVEWEDGSFTMNHPEDLEGAGRKFKGVRK